MIVGSFIHVAIILFYGQMEVQQDYSFRCPFFCERLASDQQQKIVFVA